jgi:hypothetical protein
MKDDHLAVRVLYKLFERGLKNAVRLHPPSLPEAGAALHRLPKETLLDLFVNQRLTGQKV